MSVQALSILIVGDTELPCEELFQKADWLELRRAATLSAVPPLCGAQPADVILLGAIQHSSFDPTIIQNLREQDAALGRYTCVAQCVGHGHKYTIAANLSADIDDFLDISLDDTTHLRRLKLFGRIASLESQLRQIKLQGHHSQMLLQDPLTGLGNWRYLTNHLESLLLETQARGGLTCCALFTIDRLDYITEHYGQIVRNEALRGVALRLRKILRPTDVIARTSDNEFGIALRYSDGGHPRPWVFERLLRAVSYPAFTLSKQQMEITISLGVCYNKAQSEFTPFDMLAVAGTQMREAQAAGGNTLRL